MKLYIKQKVFSWGDKFTVKDEAGRDRYYVEGEIFTWGKKLHVYDMAGREVAFIKQEVWSWMPRYYVFCGNRQVAEIKKEFTFLFPKYNSRNTPTAIPMMLPVFSRSVNKPMAQGTIINNVHQPSKKTLIFVILNSFRAHITPAAIKTMPHNTLPAFFIFYFSFVRC